MATIFFPSCKATRDYKESSKLLREYMNQKYGLKPIGCCKVKNKELTEEDTAIILCLNCERVIRKESVFSNMKYIWEVIDKDDSFVFPDYKGEKITLQHCIIAREKEDFKNTIRSLLRKMNFDIIEMEEREEDHCPSSEIMGYHRERPLNEDELKEFFTDKYKDVPTDRIVSYCKYCNDGVHYSDKTGVHLLELLFPASTVLK